MRIMRTGSKSASWFLGLLLVCWGCGYEGELPATSEPPPPPVPPSGAAITLSLSPSPIAALVATDDGALWSAEWTLTVRETAGVGGDIDFVRATLADDTGASIAETELGAEQVSEQLGGSNHIAGGSTQEIVMDLGFDFPEDVLSGNLNVTLQLSDDKGNTVSAVADTVIQICIPSLLAPDAGATVDNGCENTLRNGLLWEFDWSDCAGADFYHIYVQLRSEEGPQIENSELTQSSYTVLEERRILEEDRFGWFWKVRANLNGVWGDWSPEREFVVEPVNTDCATP